MRRLLWLATLSLSSLGQAVVHYHLDFQPSEKQVSVTIQLDSPGKVETFRIPAWAPGFYQIAQYQKNISHLQAKTPDGQSLKINRDGARSWQIEDPDSKPYVVSYAVEGNEEGLGFFATSVHETNGYVNGASAFMYLDARITEPTTLKITTPSGWDIATPLETDSAGEYDAGGYDELIDSPIQVGTFVRKSFTARGVPFQAVFVAPEGNIRADVDAEVGRISKLVVPAIKLFGKTPFKHYTFFVHLATGSFSGGLEHRASTVLNVPNSNPLGIDDLVTHEYFHSWNVKNIRPAVLGPFDYTKEVRTDNLWFAEGVTDYYAKITAHQSGLENNGYLFQQLSDMVNTLQRSRDRTKYTLAQASQGAWEGGSEGLGDLSYYDKGLIVGLVLDAEIRSATSGSKSLDDVMRLLFERHRLPLPGYTEGEIRTTVNEVAGTDLSPYYNALVYSTNEVSYQELQKIGVRVIEPSHPFRDAGFRISPAGKIVQLTDSLKTSGMRLDDAISVEKLDGDQATLLITRGHVVFHVTAPVKTVMGDKYLVEPDPLATAEQTKLRDAWYKR